MDIKDFANKLNGNQYRKEMSLQDRDCAKQHGFVVVFGYSDDNMEFRGAINDEVGCYNGGMAYINEDGLFKYECCNEDCKYHQSEIERSMAIEAVWCGDKGYTWHYETDIPHETFAIGGDNQCLNFKIRL